MGRTTTGLLLDEIRHPDSHEHDHVTLHPTLIIRESSRRS